MWLCKIKAKLKIQLHLHVYKCQQHNHFFLSTEYGIFALNMCIDRCLNQINLCIPFNSPDVKIVALGRMDIFLNRLKTVASFKARGQKS